MLCLHPPRTGPPRRVEGLISLEGFLLDQAPLTAGLLQFLPELRVGDGDQCLRSFRLRPAIEVRDAPLGNDVARVVPRHRHAGAPGGIGNDARDRIVEGRGGDQVDGPAALGPEGPDDEVQLAAGARPHQVPHGLGDDLPRQVNLNGAVDGHHIVLLADRADVVRVNGGTELHHGVVPQKIVKLLITHRECQNDLAGIDFLVLAGDNALIDQLVGPRRGHLRMDPQVLETRVLQKLTDGRRDGPDAHLDAVAVFEETDDVLRHLLLLLVRFRRGHGDEGTGILHKGSEALHGEVALPVGPGHVGVDLGDDPLTLVHNLLGKERVETQVHVAVFVRGGHLGDHSRTAFVHPLPVGILHRRVGTLEGYEIGPFGLGEFLQMWCAVEAADQLEGIPVLGLEDLIGPKGKTVDILHILQFILPVGNGVHNQHGRLPQKQRGPETVSRLDDLGRFLRRHQPAVVILSPTHAFPSF